jgi:hypothetical protein
MTEAMVCDDMPSEGRKSRSGLTDRTYAQGEGSGLMAEKVRR